MSLVSITLHCSNAEAARLKMTATPFSGFCMLRLENSGDQICLHLPLSMNNRLSRAADAFNAALAETEEAALVSLLEALREREA